MGDVDSERAALADHLTSRRAAILEAWRVRIQGDPALTSGNSLPRVQLLDHIPDLLATFEREVRNAPSPEATREKGTTEEVGAAHGLQRWQQGYGLREVTHEWGKLNECVIAELDGYTLINPQISHAALATARGIWSTLCSTGIEESVGQYFQLQQQESAGHVRDLEGALQEIRELETQRADLWRQAAHDLRGNLGVVANATVGLTHTGLRESTRDEFIRILMRNVTTLHQLLDDVTSLARLQAGREERQVEPLDVSPILQQLCEGIRPMAQQRRLFLRSDGPPGFAADGDAVKIRRIAQNLVLNAVKFTRDGGITVSWGDSDSQDPHRWQLCVTDTGPGFHGASGQPITQALESSLKPADPDAAPAAVAAPTVEVTRIESGEGIGLSIVKRLCELLDATIEIKSQQGVGTCFRILFPRSYPNSAPPPELIVSGRSAPSGP